MATQGTLKPQDLYSTPAQQPYWDESTSTLGLGAVFDPAKTAEDYGVQNPKVYAVSETGAGNGSEPTDPNGP